MSFLKKFITSVVLGLVAMLISSIPVQATDLVVNCPDSTTFAAQDLGASCVFVNSGTTTSSEPLFSESNLAPGETISQTITVNNLDQDESCSLQMLVTENNVIQDNLAQVLRTAIYATGSTFFGNYSGGVALADKSLQNLYSQQSLDLGVVSSGDSQIYTWLMTLDGASVGNSYQGKKTSFDFSVSFTCGDPSLTPTPAPAAASGGGSVAGVTSIASFDVYTPKCESPDLFPTAPTGFTAVSRIINSVTLSWNPVKDANQYAIFFYDANNVGYSVLGSAIGNKTTYTISNLSGGGWTFELIAIGGNDNLCSSPRAKTSLTVGGTGVRGLPFGPGGAEAGEIVRVLGEQDEIADYDTIKGEVAGAKVECVLWKNYLPWLLLVAQLLSLLLIEYLYRHSNSLAKYLFIVGITVLSNILFYLLRDCQCYGESGFLLWLCRWYWIVSVLETVLTRFLGYGFIEVVEKN